MVSSSHAASFKIISPDFTHNNVIPKEFTCEGANKAPRLHWNGMPVNTKSLVLICDDPDAPAGTWVHWVVYNIPVSKTDLSYITDRSEKLADGTLQGLNSWPHVGYDGPCPPKGHGVHHYHFKLYALDSLLSLKSKSTKQEVEAAMKNHVLAQTELVGLYERKK
ncbi:YbhB/YbcL family Raf kinase inhibitor-like protein [soil metagenome]